MLLRVDTDVDHLLLKKTDPNHIQIVMAKYENKSSNGTQNHISKAS